MQNHIHLARLMFVAAALAACGDDEPGEPGGSGGAGGIGGTGGTGAAPPVLERPSAGIDGCHASFLEDGVCRPSLAKCAPGTVPDIDVGCVAVGVPSCAPELIDARGICLPPVDYCDVGFFLVPSFGCVPIDGDAGCGGGKWGAIVEAADDVHVDVSYLLNDSDGSRDKPFPSLAAAITAADDGDRLVIAEGTYEGEVLIDKPLRLEGICASKVTLSAVEPATAALSAALAMGETASLAGVAVTSETVGIAAAGGELTIERVHIHHVGMGIHAQGPGRAIVSHTLIEDTAITDSLEFAYGALASQGAQLELSQTAILRARTAGFAATDGSSLTAEDVFVDTVLPDKGAFALGVYSQGGSEVTIEASVVARFGYGVFADAAATTIRDSVVAESTDVTYGTLLSMTGQSSSVVAERNVLTNAVTAGVTQFAGELRTNQNWITDAQAGGLAQGFANTDTPILFSEKDVISDVGVYGMSLVLGAQVSGNVIEGVAFREAFGTSAGAGVISIAGGATIERTFISGAEEYGIFAPRQTALESPTTVRSSRIEAISGVDGTEGVGIAAGGTFTTLVVEKTSIADTRGAGILLSDATGEVRETVIEGVSASSISKVALAGFGDVAGPISAGLVFQGDDADGVTLTDCWFEGYLDAGVVLAGQAHRLERVRAFGGEFGLALQAGATAEATDCDFSDNSVAPESSEAEIPLPE